MARLRHDPWWRFVLYGLAAAIVPGAVSVEPFHGMRLMAYPVFLLLLTVPALEWLLARDKDKTELVPGPSGEVAKPAWERFRLSVAEEPSAALCAPGVFVPVVLAFTALETYWFQTVFRRNGPNRAFDFDVPYKEAYDIAVKQPARPIYLEDGKWGPGYIHALWYATVERRPTSQFGNLKPGSQTSARQGRHQLRGAVRAL